jgi:hypothetical protein
VASRATTNAPSPTKSIRRTALFPFLNLMDKAWSFLAN